MSRMDEYYLWKRGKLNKKLWKETIELFKTNLNDEQILALNNYDKKFLIMFLLGILVYGIFGFFLGLIAGVV